MVEIESLVNKVNEKLMQLLSSCQDNSTPFILFRYPDHDVFLASYNPKSNGSFTFAPFDQGNYIHLENVALLELHNISDFEPFEKFLHTNKMNHVNTIDRQRFINIVNLAKAALTKNYREDMSLEKVVISKAKEVKMSIDPIGTFFNLAQKYKSALVYYYYHPLSGAWVGASPEKLLEKDEANKYHIHSLAGTKGLLEEWTSKEVNEQKIVTDYITHVLEESGATHLKVEGPMDYEYGAIKHLKSSIYFHSDSDGESLVKSIHPTPAVCGLPLQNAKNFILCNEGYNRSYYTGYIGLKGLQGIHDTYYVNLRCMQVNDDNAYIYTGAGIVADSDPSSEWDEVESKAQTLLDCIKTNG
ncbi:MAG: chorismate-binding protein [Saprospiraceae bacterium]